MFHLNRTTRERINFEQLDSPPLREYTVDVVDYYKLALSSNDPYIKFISFYHVMEYFYDEVFKKKMITDLRDKITNPGFSYRDDDKIYEMALFVKNRLRMNDESGQGNELESLKFVLNEYVTIDELKNRISSMDSTAITYYQTNKVIFCNAPTIPWTDLQGVYTQIARRIYFTRNSLVHSKSGKNQERYKPYKDEKQLQKEKYIKQSLRLIQNISYDIDDKKHRIHWILEHIKHLNNDTNPEISKAIEQYQSKNTYQKLVASKNPVFDILISVKINRLQDDNISIKPFFEISQNEKYDDLDFIDVISEILDYVKRHNEITLHIKGQGIYTLVELYSENDFYDYDRCKIESDLIVKKKNIYKDGIYYMKFLLKGTDDDVRENL